MYFHLNLTRPNVMASFTIKLNNTFQDTFINVLDAKINNLKDIIVNEIGIDETNDEIPESEDNSIENNQMSLKHVVLEIIAQFI